MKHAIDYYKDGFKSVAFCKVCGLEGPFLLEECSGDYEKDLHKDVDKLPEHS